MSDSTNLLTTLSTVLGTLLALAVEIALLVIALAFVKPRRPDAAMPFVIAAAVNVMVTLMWPILSSFVIPLMASDSTAGSRTATYAVFSLFLNLLRAVSAGLILFGIVRLASPPGGAPRDPTRYG